MEGNCAGHRAELAIIETAKAIAAFDKRKYITAEDTKKAAEFALPHRIRQMPPQQPFENNVDHQENDYSNNGNQDENTCEANTNGDFEQNGQTKDRESQEESNEPCNNMEDNTEHGQSQNNFDSPGSNGEE